MTELEEFTAKLAAEKDGLFLTDVSHETYIAHEAISQSELGTVTEMSPFHYKFKKDHPSYKQTPDMLIGSATHKIFFEPEEFDNEFICAPELNLRTKAGRAEMEEFKEETKSSGKSVLTAEQMATVREIGAALHKQEHVMKWIKGGVAEKSIFRYHNGQILKTRPDYYIKKSNVIIDLKTCRDITYAGFMRSVLQYRYHVQAAAYTDSVAHFVGEAPRFLNLCVEKKPPYAAVIYELEPSFLMVGRAEYIRALATIKECKDNNVWPSFPVNPVPMGCPEWLWESFKKRVRS